MGGTIKRVLSTIRSKPAGRDGLTESEARSKTGKHGDSLADMISSARQGRLVSDASTAVQALKTLSSGEPMDDRKLMLEHGVAMLQHLPQDSKVGNEVANEMIQMLYRDLEHPSSVRSGDRFRAADGSGNNPDFPSLGAAGTAYSKSVPAIQPSLPNLPDPELVFDLLLKREEFKPHPSGLNGIFVAFANSVIHNVFQTRRSDPNINDTSSYVDLSILYGNTVNETNKIRPFRGDGQIYPDSIASERIMLMPQTTILISILFSRSHNWIADRVLQINEAGWYTLDLASLTAQQRAKQDEEVFQLARNINIACYARCVLTDYVSAILNTARANSDWHLELGDEIKTKDGSRSERGKGNLMSTEFNILYRWHSLIPQADADYMNNMVKETIGKQAQDCSPQEFWRFADTLVTKLRSQAPLEWTIPGLKRGKDGKYADHDLAQILVKACEEKAGAFGVHGSPPSMRLVDILGIKQARAYNLCTLNEFRSFLGLAKLNSFLEWNPDPNVAAAAEMLYGHIDHLELYPGLHAEIAKPAMSGSGVCPPQTVGRAILSDAVSLIRGDRFLTTGLDKATLTSWGMAFVATKTPGSYGGMLATVIFNALPESFAYNSGYVLLPFYTPRALDDILADNRRLATYTLARPDTKPALVSIKTFAGCKNAFANIEELGVFYNNSIRLLTNDQAFFIGMDGAHEHDPIANGFMKAFLAQPAPKKSKKSSVEVLTALTFEQSAAAYFQQKIDQLVTEAAFAVDGNTLTIDIVRDVLNVAPVYWVSHKFGIPLKTQKNPGGLLTPRQLNLAGLACFILSSFDVVNKAGFGLREVAIPIAETLCKIIRLRFATATGLSDIVQDFVSRGTAFEHSEESETYYREASQIDVPSLDARIGHTLGIMLPAIENLSQQAALLVDLYLKPEYALEREAIVALAQGPPSEETDQILLGYIREGMRIAPVVIGLPREARKDCKIVDGDNVLSLKAGQKVVIGISAAHMDPKAFPDPYKIDPTRPAANYILLGHGIHYCFGWRLWQSQMIQTIKSVFALPNLRRAPERAGQLNPIISDLAGLQSHMYLDESCKEIPSPQFLRVLFDKPANEFGMKASFGISDSLKGRQNTATR